MSRKCHERLLARVPTADISATVPSGFFQPTVSSELGGRLARAAPKAGMPADPGENGQHPPETDVSRTYSVGKWLINPVGPMVVGTNSVNV